jgi:hypothetical protein
MYNQPCSLSQIQEREAYIRALAELSRALDKKASAARLVPHFHFCNVWNRKQNKIIFLSLMKFCLATKN